MFGYVSLQCKSQPKCINCGNKKLTDGEVCPRPTSTSTSTSTSTRTALLAVVIVRANINPTTKFVQLSSMKRLSVPWPRKEIFHWLKPEPSFRIRRPRLHQQPHHLPLSPPIRVFLRYPILLYHPHHEHPLLYHIVKLRQINQVTPKNSSVTIYSSYTSRHSSHRFPFPASIFAKAAITQWNRALFLHPRVESGTY